MYVSAEQVESKLSPLDKLLAQTVASLIRTKLGEKTFSSLENRLTERYNLDVVDAIQDFTKFDATLREFFGAGADAIESDILHEVVSLESSKKGTSLLTIENKELAHSVLETYGNSEKRTILNEAFKNPSPTLDILERCNIPKSTGYRIMNELIKDGFLTESGFSTTSDGKKVTNYTALFSQIKIDIELEEVIVQVLLKDEVVEGSSLVKILQGRF